MQAVSLCKSEPRAHYEPPLPIDITNNSHVYIRLKVSHVRNQPDHFIQQYYELKYHKQNACMKTTG